VVLLATGAIGRYFYAYVPRATNGRELALAEVKADLLRAGAEWDAGQQQFRDRVRTEVLAMVEQQQWKSTFLGRIVALLGDQRRLRRKLALLAADGRQQGLAPDQIDSTLALAQRAHRAAMMAAHYEDLRLVLSSWRYLHRWFAALMVLLVVLHVVHALAYGSFFAGGGAG
jgi:dihydropyrimidine dehydrogenase (NAD+) subunit PreT